jgi:two-component system, OmpR family, phosphate regulon sensor histidine kinase PhoR
MTIDLYSPNQQWSMLIHDLRNPVATVRAYAQLLRRQTTNDRIQPRDIDQSLRYIQDATTRIECLLDQIADGPEPLYRAATGPTDLIVVARHIAAQSQPVPGGPERIVVLHEIQQLSGFWDRVALERILANLFDNALKYSPEDRSVLVTLRQSGERAVVSVADQGVGIAPDDLPFVFDPGYRARNAARLASGKGIGLAAVRTLVDALGGSVSIDSREGTGTTVSFSLPLNGERDSRS